MNAPSNRAEKSLLQWLCVLGGPVAWLIQFEINYALVRSACIHHSPLVLLGVSGGFLLLLIIIGAISAVQVRQNRGPFQNQEEREARGVFMSALGLGTSSLFGLIIIAQSIPSFILDPCRQ
jgi:hypothetical protein